MVNIDANKPSSSSENATKDKKAKEDSGSSRIAKHSWWQWFFLYPAFGVALLTAAPEWISSVGQLADKLLSAKTFDETQLTSFMERNKECVKAPFRWVDVSNDTKVDGTICSETGDVWLVVNVQDRTAYKGIDISEIVKSKISFGDLLSSTAYASTRNDIISRTKIGDYPNIGDSGNTKLTQSLAIVVCQKFLGSQIIRHIRVNNICYDESINSTNGLVQSRTQVPCRSSC